jgi:hypothetical protein
MYTSDVDKIMRYTDEVRAEMEKISSMADRVTVLLKGETVELCRWTVDIGSLPSFQENANVPTQDGFYTGRLNGKSLRWFT